MLERSRAFLERKGVEEARLEADLLVAHALDVDRLHLLMGLDQPVGEEELARARTLLQRRGKREPVAYITGKREFYGRPFQVRPGVLVPRPETELLVDLARDHLASAGMESPRVLDVGTGSGCLALTLALEVPGAQVSAVDSSAAALDVARENGEALGAEVTWITGDGLETAEAAGPWDLIVSNPPYIDPAQRGTLAPEVAEHEPAEALFAPAGDVHLWVRELARGAARWLKPGGLLLVELGHDQGTTALEFGQASGLNARLEKDLAGIDRVLALGA